MVARRSAMNTVLWVCQIALAGVFLYSGVNKALRPVDDLVARGQTGVEGLPASLVHAIGASELLGVVGLILPWWSQIVPQLTPIAASCLAVVVLLATGIHIKRREFGTSMATATLVALCAFVALGRFRDL
jgi:uncharacterized membrane protein YphA (DoxX/SURF4 family)